MTEETGAYYIRPAQRLKYFLVRKMLGALGFVFAHVPESVSYSVCQCLLLFSYYAVPRYRRLMMKHLTIAFGNEMSDRDIRRIAIGTYKNYGKNLAEFLMFPSRRREWFEKKVNFNDPRFHIRTALEKGKGVVGLGAH
ncbi:MAG: hypothetical protein AB1742_01350, partial [bacterium]